MAIYQSERVKLGSAAKSGLYATWTYTQVGRAPADVLNGVTLATNDQIQLFKVASPGRLFNYNIDMPILDSGGTIRLSLTDGTNVFQAAITASAAQRLSAINAAPATMGAAVRYDTDTLIYLLVTTGAGAATGNIQIFATMATQNE